MPRAAPDNHENYGRYEGTRDVISLSIHQVDDDISQGRILRSLNQLALLSPFLNLTRLARMYP
jgi:hypothetical protein